MAKVISLNSTSVDIFGGIKIVLGKNLVEDGDTMSSEQHVSVMSPDGDITKTLDDTDAYLTLNKWPALSTEQRQIVIDLDTAARANPTTEANRQKWITESEARAAAEAAG
jgi:hypothetical protein